MARVRLAVLKVVSAVLLTLSAASLSWGQSSEGGFTPPGMAPGSPLGSYKLGDFEDINLFNGKPNFTLPLLQIEGRGKTAYPMSLTRQSNWNVEVLPSPPGSP